MGALHMYADPSHRWRVSSATEVDVTRRYLFEATTIYIITYNMWQAYHYQE
jgi:hypothetical protein